MLNGISYEHINIISEQGIVFDKSMRNKSVLHSGLSPLNFYNVIQLNPWLGTIIFKYNSTSFEEGVSITQLDPRLFQ